MSSEQSVLLERFQGCLGQLRVLTEQREEDRERIQDLEREMTSLRLLERLGRVGKTFFLKKKNS